MLKKQAKNKRTKLNSSRDFSPVFSPAINLINQTKPFYIVGLHMMRRQLVISLPYTYNYTIILDYCNTFLKLLSFRQGAGHYLLGRVLGTIYWLARHEWGTISTIPISKRQLFLQGQQEIRMALEQAQLGFSLIQPLFRPISKPGQILSSTLFFQIMLLPKSSLSSGLRKCYCNYIFAKE